MKQLTIILIGILVTSASGETVLSKSRRSIDTLESLIRVSCTLKTVRSILMGQLSTCSVIENIEHEDYILQSTLDNTVKAFDISDNRKVKFLPMRIGENFPKLIRFATRRCGLTVVRDHYFKNMQKLEFMDLKRNKIESIAGNAFKDLVSLTNLNLENNRIEILDESLLSSMIKLEFIELNSNKIKFLSPKTFKIPGGKLGRVRLRSNTCLDRWYGVKYQLNQLEFDIKANCTR